MSFLERFKRRTQRPDPGRLVLRRTIGEERLSYEVEHQTMAGATAVSWPTPELPDGCTPLDSRDDLALELLDELRRDGIVAASANGFELSFSAVPDLDPDLAGLLGLAAERGWSLELGLRGRVGRGESEVTRRWTAPDGRFAPSLDEVACGLVDRQRGRLHVVPKELSNVAAIAREGHDGTPPGEYSFLARLQQAAALVAPLQLKLDAQLQSESYVAPASMGVEVEAREDGGLRLRPRLEGVSASVSQLLRDRERLGPGFVAREPADPRHRVRVVVPAEVGSAFEAVQRRRDIDPDDVARFVDDPRAFIGAPDAADVHLDLDDLPGQLADLDLSNFSGRVVAVSEEAPAVRQLEATRGTIDWFGGEAPPAERSEEHDGVAGTDDASSSSPTAPQLITADNDEELQFDASAAAELRQVAGTLSPPQSFKGTLRAFQREGYAWLHQLDDAAASGPVGGLLADDMGLGKTVQIIAHLARLHDEQRDGPTLLVAPSAVVANWRAELAKFCPAIRWVTVHTGSSRTRDIADLRRSEVILTTYDTLVRDQLILGQLELQLLVCDEAQYIKNYTTRRARACRAMSARVRVALSATPVENSLNELWSIMDFCQPGLLGAFPEFRQTFAEPIASDDDDAAGAAAHELLRKLGRHYLRRTKRALMRTAEGAAALGLPPKNERIHRLRMPPGQRDAYLTALRAPELKGPLARLERLFMVSVHPALGTDNFDAVIAAAHADLDAFLAHSSKLAFLFGELEQVRARSERAVIFVHRRGVQQLLAAMLRRRFGIRAHIVNGSVGSGERLELVRAFNATPGFDVLVLSPLAAGVGLNITGANHVFHLMRLWNPAKENQATDRCYRIGQTRQVEVHVPVAVADDGHERPLAGMPTVDDRLHELLERKRALAEHVVRPSATQSISWKELEGCLSEAGVPELSTAAGPPVVGVAAPFRDVVDAVCDAGMPAPIADFTLNDETGAYVASLDVAWPEARVAIVSERKQDHRERALRAGWTCFRLPAVPAIVVSHVKRRSPRDGTGSRVRPPSAAADRIR